MNFVRNKFLRSGCTSARTFFVSLPPRFSVPESGKDARHESKREDETPNVSQPCTRLSGTLHLTSTIVKEAIKCGDRLPLKETLRETIQAVDKTLGEKIQKTAENLEVCSQTATHLIDKSATFTTQILEHSGSTLRQTVPTINDVKIPEPLKKGLQVGTRVTSQGVDLVNNEQQALASFVAKVSTKIVFPDEGENKTEGEQKDSSTWLATKNLVSTSGRAVDKILDVLESSVGSVKGKAEEELVELVKEKLGGDAGELVKDGLAIGSNILSLKDTFLNPKGVGKSFSKEVSKQVLKEFQQSTPPTSPFKE
eukprot:TRINITY_DN1388_c0_g1_i1.p1 TRINITY_DN1388_c0_g1~~TRINITY_DN1388_c0_g1_i1.p1  ORF type:complete len:310 (+),score=66.66 TRINITY_DN1388_c0_g1_i1:1516-2445(+)